MLCPASRRLLHPTPTHAAASATCDQVLAHICSAIDYKDNDKLLEDHVNHMATNTLRPEGVCVKLVTRPGEHLPGVYVEDRNRNVLHTTALGNEHESHFEARCQECVLP